MRVLRLIAGYTGLLTLLVFGSFVFWTLALFSPICFDSCPERWPPENFLLLGGMLFAILIVFIFATRWLWKERRAGFLLGVPLLLLTSVSMLAIIGTAIHDWTSWEPPTFKEPLPIKSESPIQPPSRPPFPFSIVSIMGLLVLATLVSIFLLVRHREEYNGN